MPRMRILNTVEEEAFESPPAFNSVQRKRYFDFSSELQALAKSLQTPTNQVCFLVVCGYFKATKKFFAGHDFQPRDLAYVCQQIQVSPEVVTLTAYSDRTRQRHVPLILKFYGFRAFDQAACRWLEKEIASLVRSQLKPKLILWRCVDRLVREKIEVPSYSRLVGLVLGSVNNRKKELTTAIERALTQETRGILDTLLTQEVAEDGTPPGKTTAYKLTLMKKVSQSTKPSKVKERAADLDLIRELYRRIEPVLKVLTLAPEGIRYFAHSVIKSEIFQLTRRDAEDRYLHLAAFITHQYYRLQDNLIDVLVNSLQSFQNGAIREHKEQCYARREQRNESLKALVGYLDKGLVGTLATIDNITEDAALSDTEKVKRIRALLATRQARRLLEDDKLAGLREALVSELSEDDYYKILESKSVRIQNRVSPVLKTLSFQGEPGARDLLAAIEHFKENDGAIDKTAPFVFLDPTGGSQ